MDAANEFTGDDHDRYVTAAQNLRIPFWDWARPVTPGQHVAPDSISSPGIVVNTPQQAGVTIQNPLYSYRFHPTDSRLGSPVSKSHFIDVANHGILLSLIHCKCGRSLTCSRQYSSYATTIRYPTTTDSSAQSQEDQMISGVDAQQDGLRQRVYNILSNRDNYTTVACEGPSCQGGTAGFDSIESIHDVIHVVTGGNGGSMTNIGVSAFDPLFWCHHTMIDRLSALFEALNPDSYVLDAPQARSNWWYNKNDVKGAGDALKPFYSDTNGNFHTSDSIRDHTKFGYTYSELTSGKRDDIVASINQLYGGTTAPAAKRKRSLVDDITSTLGSDLESYLPSREYVTNIQADKYGKFGSYFIHVFLGEPSSDPASWSTDPNLVGTHAIFSTAADETSGQAAIPVTGSMPLTDALSKHHLGGKLASLAEAIIVPYLTTNLIWKAQKVYSHPYPTHQHHVNKFANSHHSPMGAKSHTRNYPISKFQ